MPETKNNNPAKSQKRQIPVREGYFHQVAGPADESYLIGGKCSHCGCISFPLRVVCPDCMHENSMKEMRLSRRGKIFTYTVLHVPLPGFPAPYTVAFVELPEGPKIYSLITGCKPIQGVLEVGTEVELVIGKITEDNEGNDIIGYMFKPVNVS